jgi:hypothetical protein
MEVTQTLFHAVANFGALIVTTFFAFFDAVMMIPFLWGASRALARTPSLPFRQVLRDRRQGQFYAHIAPYLRNIGAAALFCGSARLRGYGMKPL